MTDAPTPAPSGFDVWSVDDSSGVDPDPTPGSVYLWDEELVPRNGVDVVGRAVFRATVQQDESLNCTGWIEIDGGQPWTGTVLLRGTLRLDNGKVGTGRLDVIGATAGAGVRHVQVSRENPKRYVATN